MARIASGSIFLEHSPLKSIFLNNFFFTARRKIPHSYLQVEENATGPIFLQGVYLSVSLKYALLSNYLLTFLRLRDRMPQLGDVKYDQARVKCFIHKF